MSSPTAWSPHFEPPAPVQTSRLRFEVLRPEVAEIDYVAIMGSRVRLRRELQWGKDGRFWPVEEFTLEGNREDLAEHFGELERREAYAYTVLDPSGETCVGCIYIEPAGDDARLAFWVIDSELDTGLERHLVETVLDWIDRSWPFDRVLISLRAENPRGIALCERLGLEANAEGGLDDHTSFAWLRRS